jgi:hypothetical protein
MSSAELLEWLEQAEERALQAEQRQQEAQQLQQEAQQELEDVQQKAQQEVQDAQQKAQQQLQDALQKAQQQVQDARQRLRESTLSEYLMACHDHIGTKLIVETNSSKITTGFTSPNGRRFPTTLRPWTRFFDHRDQILRHFLEVYPFDSDPPRVFQNLEKVRGIGEQPRVVMFNSEAHLVFF